MYNDIRKIYDMQHDNESNATTSRDLLWKVVEGMDVVRLVEKEGSSGGKTKRPVVIEDCGEIGAFDVPQMAYAFSMTSILHTAHIY